MSEIKKHNLHVYNSLTRQKEKFEPLKKGFVGVYVCGPTVYGDSHLGHAKSYISFDVIVRYLRYLGYHVRYVQNITDVGHLQSDADEGEDKIAAQARREKLEPMEVVERYTRSYFEDMDALSVLRPDISPRASGHIPEQIAMIEELIEKGFAYEVNGNVYFSVEKFKDYGKLSGRSLDDVKSGTRVEAASDKHNAADFALWKSADPSHIMRWKSPWGWGYPGWHVECSVMSTKYLGETFDIHGGGMENKFPHHECEIAQSEATFEKPFARYWLHNNMVTVDGVKMGKSLGNFITIKDALENHSALAIRFFILSSHYGSTLDFSEEAIGGAAKGLKKIHETMSRLRDASAGEKGADKAFEEEIATYRESFGNAMDEDFNSPKAIAAVFDFAKRINARLDLDAAIPQNTYDSLMTALNETLGDVLAILPGEENQQQGGADSELLEGALKLLIDLRNKARKERNFAFADEIRDRLIALDVEIKDTPQGTEWKRK